MKKTFGLMLMAVMLMSVGIVSANSDWNRGNILDRLSQRFDLPERVQERIDNDEVRPGPAIKQRLMESRVRAVHLSPDAPAVDVKVNGNVAISSLSFGEASDYAALRSAEYNFKVVPSGLDAPVVIEADLELDKRKDYSVVAVNYLSDIEPIVIEDRRYKIDNGKAMIRFVHASPDAPAVDVALKDGPVLFSDVEFKEVEDYIRVPKGEYDLEVRLAGTENVVLEVPGVMLDRGVAYSAFAKGLVADETLGALLVEDRKSIAKNLRFR